MRRFEISTIWVCSLLTSLALGSVTGCFGGSDSAHPVGNIGSVELLSKAAHSLKNRFDAKHGGLAGPGKSPLDVPIRFLLRFYKRTADPEALEFVERTLRNASAGRIHDTKAGGFFKESSSDDWNSPVTEKRLSDQAVLAVAAFEAGQASGNAADTELGKELVGVVSKDLDAGSWDRVSQAALGVSALADASLVLNDAKYAEQATRVAQDLLAKIKPESVTDSAYLGAALLDLHEATGDPRWVERALELSERAYDALQGGGDAEALHDRRAPSPNGATALSLLRLSELTARKDLHDQAETLLRHATPVAESDPAAADSSLVALDFYLDRPKEIVIVTPPGARADAGLLLSELRRRFVPNHVLVITEAGPAQEDASKLVPLIAKKYPIANKATAYVCEKGVCKFPTNDPAKFAGLLGDKGRS